MFVQVIEGKLKDQDLLTRQLERWRKEIKPGAKGYLGSTGGATADGRSIAVVRFESEAAARANSERAEQGAWWNETSKAFDGEPNFTESSDTELLFRHLDTAWAESRRHENNHSSLLQDQVKHDRSVYAAARRAAAEWQSALAGLYLNAAVRKAASPVTGLIYRISQMPDRPGAKVVEELKAAAQQAEWMLDGVVRDAALAEIGERDPDVKLAEAQAAEIERLRTVIVQQGQNLHTDNGPRTGPRCECPGCELIRAMDDVPVEHTTSAAKAA